MSNSWSVYRAVSGVSTPQNENRTNPGGGFWQSTWLKLPQLYHMTNSSAFTDPCRSPRNLSSVCPPNPSETCSRRVRQRIAGSMDHHGLIICDFYYNTWWLSSFVVQYLQSCIVLYPYSALCTSEYSYSSSTQEMFQGVAPSQTCTKLLPCGLCRAKTTNNRQIKQVVPLLPGPAHSCAGYVTVQYESVQKST